MAKKDKKGSKLQRRKQRKRARLDSEMERAAVRYRRTKEYRQCVAVGRRYEAAITGKKRLHSEQQEGEGEGRERREREGPSVTYEEGPRKKRAKSAAVAPAAAVAPKQKFKKRR